MQDARGRQERNAPPPHPKTKGKTQGKHGKGNPTNPEETKRHKARKKMPPHQNDTKSGEHLGNLAQLIEAVVQQELVQLEKKNKSSQTKKQKNNIMEHLSRVCPPKPVVLKRKSSRQRTPPRDPKTPSQIYNLTRTGT